MAKLVADTSQFVLVTINDAVGLKRRDAEDSDTVFVDFCAPALSYRATSAVKQQGLSKAVGIKGALRPRVLDATAGFGKDAYLLASQGCRVTLFERDPLVCALLRDGIARARGTSDPSLAETLARMALIEGDFLSHSADGEWDVVYLDPMFPESKKSARVKKDMFALQEHLGAADDGEQMWLRACEVACKRVVVKRSKSAPLISAAKPDIQYKGTSSRFDVYLTPK